MNNNISKTNNLKKQDGITLIGLAITIIVLAILLGVSLGSLSTRRGVTKEAKGAKAKTEIAQLQEKIQMKLYDAEAQSSTLITKEEIKEILDQYFSDIPELESTRIEEIQVTTIEDNYKVNLSYLNGKLLLNLVNEETN